MNFIKVLFLSVLLMVSCRVKAQEWIKVAESPTFVYSVLAGSFMIGNNDGGKKIYAITGKIDQKNGDKIIAAHWYVTYDHCLLKKGKLIMLDTVGNYVADYDFIIGIGNVGSDIAKLICSVGFALEAAKPTSKPNRNNTI